MRGGMCPLDLADHRFERWRRKRCCRLWARVLAPPDANQACPKKRPRSVGALAHPVAGWVIVADPDFAAGVARDSASNLPGMAPDDLRLVAADAVAGVGAIAVIARFGC